MPTTSPLPTFKPRARMILLLGDQLIRDAGLAVFELVKNAYDADASRCSITLHEVTDPAKSHITIKDNGRGMDEATILGVWLEPGTDFREKEKKAKVRSPKYKRLPLGEKGVGRFAAHKLGNKISLISRAEGQPEIIVKIDWSQFNSERYLSSVPISVSSREPEIFTENKTGTLIEISELRDTWSRGKVRDLNRSVVSICSPFNEPAGFKAKLILEPESDWLDDLIDIQSVLELSLFQAHGIMDNDTLTYRYSFTPHHKMKSTLKPRNEPPVSSKITMEAGKTKVESGAGKVSTTKNGGNVLDLSTFGIGTVEFDFYIFDRDPAVLELIASDKAGLKKFLDSNGGVRVYRDGMRVFNYGEAGNDWLGLGDRRVNIPTVRVSNNQIIGAVSLTTESSGTLIEKTNREGFIENNAFFALKDAVIYALTQIEAERGKDKERVRKAYSRASQREPVVEDVAELREELKKRNLTQDLGKYVDRIESQFVEVRDRLLTAAGAGLTLTTVIHEVEKIIKELVQSVKGGAPRPRLESLITHLAQMVDGLAFLARNSANKTEKASILISQALFNSEYRLRAHGIQMINGLDEGDKDFPVKCSRRLIVSTLMNLVDNSIYWLENKGGDRKQICVGTTFDIDNKPAIYVADNGPGFTDPPEYLVQPFITRRPGGMGLGLHLANEVAKLHHGQLVFPEPSDIGLQRKLDGAIVAIVFPEKA